MIWKQKKLAVFVLFVAAGSSAFAAGTATQTFAVTASVVNDCIISATNDINITSSYDPTAGTDYAPAGNNTIVLKCTKNEKATITLDGGKNAVGTQRYMLGASGNSANVLAYQLYEPTLTSGVNYTTCPAFNAGTLWTPNNVSFSVTSISANTNINISVCAQLAHGQDVPIDNPYKDTVTATVNYQ